MSNVGGRSSPRSKKPVVHSTPHTQHSHPTPPSVRPPQIEPVAATASCHSAHSTTGNLASEASLSKDSKQSDNLAVITMLILTKSTSIPKQNRLQNKNADLELLKYNCNSPFASEVHTRFQSSAHLLFSHSQCDDFAESTDHGTPTLQHP